MKNNKVAILLIGIGIFLMMLNIFNFGGESFLLIIGAIFIGVYGATEVKHQRGSIGFLIPGCLLMSLGLFNVIEHFFYLGRYHSPIFWLIFGTGFLMIHLIHYVRNGFRSMFNASWPFVVSIIFYCISIVSLFHRFYQFMVPVWVRDNLFAILLVGVGAFFLIRGKNER